MLHVRRRGSRIFKKGGPNHGRMEDFFSGCARLFALIVGQRKRGREAPERGEGVSPLPHQGVFAFLAFKLNYLVHILGEIFRILSIKNKT